MITTTEHKRAIQGAQAFLFAPGNKVDIVRKALNSEAQIIIVDLEDAVPLNDKLATFRILRDELPNLLKAYPNRIILRTNAINTPFIEQDLELVSSVGIDAIVLPKAESLAQLSEIEDRLRRPISFIPMIESAKGIDQLKSIASHPSVIRVTLGNIDLQADLNMKCSLDESELLPLKFEMVVASRLFNLAAPIDGVTVNFQFTELIKAHIESAKRIGFAGKLCIHPIQVGPVIKGFKPSTVEIENAQAIISAAVNSNGAAVQFNGKMVDRPVVLMAQQILQQAGIQ